MSEETKPTPGPWTVFEPKTSGDTYGIDGGDGSAVVWYGHQTYGAGIRKIEDAIIIAEAGTVYHETGLTPRQLAEQRDELFAALVECAGRLEIQIKHTEDLIAHMRACKIIAKVEAKP